LVSFDYHFCAPPASPAAVGEAQRSASPSAAVLRGTRTCGTRDCFAMSSARPIFPPVGRNGHLRDESMEGLG
jgi:hypothetical protein